QVGELKTIRLHQGARSANSNSANTNGELRMNRLLRILLLATAPLAVSGAAAAQSLDGVKLVEAGKLTYGVAASFAPFEYVNEGKLTGFDIDFIQALAEK